MPNIREMKENARVILGENSVEYGWLCYCFSRRSTAYFVTEYKKAIRNHIK